MPTEEERRDLQWFTRHDIVATLQDGRVIAMGRSYIVSGTDATTGQPINVRLPDLREIEYVLQVEFYCDPDTFSPSHIGPMDKKITGNVVGFTLFGMTATTTLTAEVIAIGPP